MRVSERKSMDRHLRKLAPVARPPEPSLRAQRSIAATVATILMAARVEAPQLPVPGGAGNCGKGPSVWVTSGAATATVSANTLRVTQTTDQAVLNWASFNVRADGHVIFH